MKVSMQGLEGLLPRVESIEAHMMCQEDDLRQVQVCQAIQAGPTKDPQTLHNEVNGTY